MEVFQIKVQKSRRMGAADEIPLCLYLVYVKYFECQIRIINFARSMHALLLRIDSVDGSQQNITGSLRLEHAGNH